MGYDCWKNKGFYIVGKQCMYNGIQIPNPPRFDKSNTNLTILNNKVYLNGYEYFPNQRKWRRTFKAIWHYFF